MIAPMIKVPYGFFFKTEKTRHKDMTLRKEKRRRCKTARLFLFMNTCFNNKSNTRIFSFPLKFLNN